MQFEEAVRVMRERLGAVSFRMPPGVAREAAELFACGGQISSIATVRLQPDRVVHSPGYGRRHHGAALLRIGDLRALPEFIRWFAPFQRKRRIRALLRGPDWAGLACRHDCHGQLIYGVMSPSVTGDRGFSRDGPYVRKAARFMKVARRTAHAEYRRRQDRALRLLPESRVMRISRPPCILLG